MLRGFFCFSARYKSLQTTANVTHLLKEVLPFLILQQYSLLLLVLTLTLQVLFVQLDETFYLI